MNDDTPYTVVLNPVSGVGHGASRREAITAAFAAHGVACRIVETTPETGAQEIARRAVEAGASRIAVSGGDGTVREVLSGLVGSDIPVALLPAGTGNLLALNLGVPLDTARAVEVALSGVSQALDLARTERGQYFAIMGGMGLDGQIMRDANRDAKVRFGVLAYVWAALHNLTRHRIRVSIRLDDQPPRQRRVKSVLVANMGWVAPGLQAVPTATPDDGLLDIGIVASHTPAQWLRLIVFFLLGRTLDDPEIEVYRARHVRIVADIPEPVQLDGEAIGAWSRLAVEVVPRAVRVLVPRDAVPGGENPLQQVARRRSAAPIVLAALGIGGALWWAWRRREKGRDTGR